MIVPTRTCQWISDNSTRLAVRGPTTTIFALSSNFRTKFAFWYALGGVVSHAYSRYSPGAIPRKTNLPDASEAAVANKARFSNRCESGTKATSAPEYCFEDLSVTTPSMTPAPLETTISNGPGL